MPLYGGRTVRDSALLVLGALFYTLAAPPYSWAWLAWVALTPLYVALYGKVLHIAFLYGFLYGALFCIGITAWAYSAVTTYFSLAFPFNLLCTLLLYVVSVCPYTGLVAVLSCVLMRRGQPLLRWVGIPALWVSGEYARSSFFSGFSWELLGHTQYNYLPLIQIADMTGVSGISFLLALGSYVVAEALLAFTANNECRLRRKHLGSAFGLSATAVALVWWYGLVCLQSFSSLSSSFPLTIALVQGKVPHAQRWQRVRYASTLLKYVAVTRQGVEGTHPDLVVWPEFAVGFYPDREPLLRAHMQRLTQRLQTALLLGAPRVEESQTGPRYYNSAYLFSPDGQLIDIYDKIRLLPFAEYRPLRLPALVEHQPESPSEFSAGERSTVFALPQGPFGVLICYEATYPQLARRLVQNGAQFLVNMSNETWLVAGGNAAAAQHFSLVVFRAVENRRYFVRSATAGMSGFVDPTGRPYLLSPDEEGVLAGQLFPQQERTIYTRYGDWFVATCTLLAFVSLCSGARRATRGER